MSFGTDDTWDWGHCSIFCSAVMQFRALRELQPAYTPELCKMQRWSVIATESGMWSHVPVKGGSAWKRQRWISIFKLIYSSASQVPEPEVSPASFSVTPKAQRFEPIERIETTCFLYDDLAATAPIKTPEETSYRTDRAIRIILFDNVITRKDSLDRPFRGAEKGGSTDQKCGECQKKSTQKEDGEGVWRSGGWVQG